MEVCIKTIPHSEQRYNSVGDYWVDEKSILQIRVSDMGDWKKESAVAAHEYVEYFACKAKGITIKQVDAFDIRFEDNRKKGLVAHDAEPGFDPFAPYYQQHYFAAAIEMLYAREIDLIWEEYDKAVNDLSKDT